MRISMQAIYINNFAHPNTLLTTQQVGSNPLSNKIQWRHTNGTTSITRGRISLKGHLKMAATNGTHSGMLLQAIKGKWEPQGREIGWSYLLPAHGANQWQDQRLIQREHYLEFGNLGIWCFCNFPNVIQIFPKAGPKVGLQLLRHILYHPNPYPTTTIICNRTTPTVQLHLAGPEVGLRIVFHFCSDLDLGYGRGGRQNRESPEGLQLLPEARWWRTTCDCMSMCMCLWGYMMRL